MNTLSLKHLNLVKISAIVPLSGLILALCSNPQKQTTLLPVVDKPQPSIATSPYLVLGNSDTILLDGNPPGTVLKSVEGWHVLMVDTNEISFVELNSKVPTTSPILSHQCQVITPANRSVRIDITNFLRGELQSNSVLRFTPVRVDEKPQSNKLQLGGSGILCIWAPYILSSGSYSVIESKDDNLPSAFIISDRPQDSTNYLKNISFRPLAVTKPRKCSLPNQHGIDKKGKDFQLTGDDLKAFERRFPELSHYYDFHNRAYIDVLQDYITWYGLKGIRFNDGVNANDMRIGMTGALNRLKPVDEFFNRLERDSFYFRLEGDTVVIGRRPPDSATDGALLPSRPKYP